MKSKNRILAEKIRKNTGSSLMLINIQAFRFIEMGLVPDLPAALKYMFEISKKGAV